MSSGELVGLDARIRLNIVVKALQHVNRTIEEEVDRLGDIIDLGRGDVVHGGPVGEGMVLALIALPKPPVPYEQIVWKDPEDGDWYLGTYERQGDGIWRQWSAPPQCRGQFALVAQVASPKVTFPRSVPGFKKGTWFMRRSDGEWWTKDGDDRPAPELSSWRGTERECTTFYKVPPRCHAYDALQSLNSIPWDQSCFQTSEDG